MAKLYPKVVPGSVVRVHQKIKESTIKGEKERIQVFEGMVLGRRGSGISETITVRKISDGVGVEKIFPLSMPTIEKIEVVKQAKIKRAKLFYLRDYKKKLKYEKEEKEPAYKNKRKKKAEKKAVNEKATEPVKKESSKEE